MRPHARFALAAATSCALAFGLASLARADDCTSVKAAMLATVKKPHTITINRIKDGKPVTNRMIQTEDSKYIEVNGKWHSLPVTADDLHDMEDSFNHTTITCSQVGQETIEGHAATVYNSHYKNEDAEGDAKLWIGTDGLPLKSESTLDGHVATSTYDFAHAEAPANATPMGAR